jgi:hypothetical protein
MTSFLPGNLTVRLERQCESLVEIAIDHFPDGRLGGSTMAIRLTFLAWLALLGSGVGTMFTNQPGDAAPRTGVDLTGGGAVGARYRPPSRPAPPLACVLRDHLLRYLSLHTRCHLSDG